MKAKINHAEVIRLYRMLPAKQVCKLTGLNWSTVRTIAARHQVKREGHRWTPKQVKYLLENYPSRNNFENAEVFFEQLHPQEKAKLMTIREIGDALGKTKFAVINKFRELKKSKP